MLCAARDVAAAVPAIRVGARRNLYAGVETMLRRLQSILVLCCFASTAAAGTFTLGVHGGTSIPNLRDNGGNEFSKGWSTRFAPYFGVTACEDLTAGLAVQAEVNVAPQGGKRDGLQPIDADPTMFGAPAGTQLYANMKNVAKLDYIEVPVLARYRFGSARRFSVGAGPYVGFLLSAKNETSGTGAIYLDAQGSQAAPGPAQDFSGTTDNKSSLRTVNWGLQGGLAVEQPVGPGAVSLELRGGLGLMNIQKDPANDGKNSTGNLVIALGYGFRAGPGL